MSVLSWILIVISALFLIAFAYLIIASFLLNRNTQKLLTGEKQNWFEVQHSVISISGAVADLDAQMELRYQDAVCLMEISKKDILWKKYLHSSQTGQEVTLPETEKLSVCVYGSTVVALTLSDGIIHRVHEESKFNRDLTPPNPKVLKAIHQEGLFKPLSFIFGVGFLVLVLATLLSIVFIV